MRRTVLLFAPLFLAFACGASRPAAEPATQTPTAAGGAAMERPAEPTLLLNVTSGTEDPHALRMALDLAGEALRQGRRVVLFFNVHAVPWAAKSGPGNLTFGDGPPLQEMLRERIAEGATVLVCPHCMEVARVTEDELLEGARTATPQTLFASLGPNTTVFSY
jgi:predicted peroxiredoxin